MTRLMLRVCFAGGFGDPEYEGDHPLDVDAAAELRRAGYEVFRMPDKYGGLLAHPLDDFIEAHIDLPQVRDWPPLEGSDDDKVISAIQSEVDAIVSKFGGLCWEWGPIGPDHVPFVDLFPDPEGLGPSPHTA